MRVTVLAAAALIVGCGQPSARPYTGTWHRSVADTGSAALTIRPTGAVELGTMKGPATFRGDTMIFAGAPCERGEARYLLALSDSTLTVHALGADGCALRRKTLSGIWVRR